MSHVMDRREASEFSRPNVRLRQYRILSALSEIKCLFRENLSARASESANTVVVTPEISESGILGLYRGILMFFIISFYRTCRSKLRPVTALFPDLLSSCLLSIYSIV